MPRGCGPTSRSSSRPFHGKPLAFLDSAASSQKPRQVLDAMTHFYETSYANVHRGVYELAERATEGLEHARERCRAFVNAPAAHEIIFVRNATEAINLVAYAWGLANLGPGDVVLVTELEHHANFVPWQYIAGKTGAEFRMLPVEPDGTLHLEQLDELAGDGNVKVVATGYVSNVLGGANDVPRIAAWAHERGAIHVCDAAQAAPHKRVDVQALGTDFVAVSGHKMCGPSGIGFLWGRTELLRAMDPFLTGGHMIRRVRRERVDLGRAAAQVRGGHGADGRGGRARRGDRLPRGGRPRGDRAARARARRLRARPAGRDPRRHHAGVRRPERRAGIVSFDVEGVHPHDVAQILDLDAVAIRAGHHCCQPLMQRLGVAATNRASFYLYTVPEEIDRLAAGLWRVKETFGV